MLYVIIVELIFYQQTIFCNFFKGQGLIFCYQDDLKIFCLHTILRQLRFHY